MTPEEANQLIAHRLQQMVDLLVIIAMNTTHNRDMGPQAQSNTMRAIGDIDRRKQ